MLQGAGGGPGRAVVDAAGTVTVEGTPHGRVWLRREWWQAARHPTGSPYRPGRAETRRLFDTRDEAVAWILAATPATGQPTEPRPPAG